MLMREHGTQIAGGIYRWKPARLRFFQIRIGQFFLNIGWHRVVMRKLHRETSQPACHAAERSRISCYLSQRNLAVD